MISNPKYGWCDFTLGGFNGNPSYITDVPLDLLDAFINYYNKGYGVATLDEEGYEFLLVLNRYNLGVYVLSDRVTDPENELWNLYDFSSLSIDDLAKELIFDIENDFLGWVHFLTSSDEVEEMVNYACVLSEQLKALKKLVKYDSKIVQNVPEQDHLKKNKYSDNINVGI